MQCEIKYQKKFTFYGQWSKVKIPLIYVIKMQKLLESGFRWHLFYSVKAEENEKGVDDIGVFQDIPRKYLDFHHAKKWKSVSI